MDIHHINESTIMLAFGQTISPLTTAQIAHCVPYLHQTCGHHIIDITPSYTKIMIQYGADHAAYQAVLSAIKHWQYVFVEQSKDGPLQAPTLHQLPVYYHEDVGPDLARVAAKSGLTPQEVIACHSQKKYDVGAIGFSPGFAFLSSVDPAIAMARHTSPRLRVLAGSVGIADRQTAVYPDQSPGGWHIIGNCPQSLFLNGEYPLSRFSIGDQVQFMPITREVFLAQGGQLWKHC